jgi:serine/threonine-protein kinase
MGDDASDVEVARVLESYLAALEAGQPSDPRRLLEEHPELADRLRACLRVLRVAEQAVQEVSDASGVPQGRRPAALSQGSGAALRGLSILDFGPGESPHVLLRELPDEAEPLIKPHSGSMPGRAAPVGRLQLQGEIARGGMGAIFKGRDADLGRDLAIKVLLESHQRNPDVVRRFVEEAQIGGQLQHPGVVPVYELGTFPDRRPYFAMKLVKGRTLAALLAERHVKDHANVGARSVPRPERDDTTRPGREHTGRPDRGTEPPPTGTRAPTEGIPAYEDLPRFLSIFEQVCQTMAYAHARGVAHRDLKPANIMVGSFGEVQVMDWGLAKVLPQGGVADEGGSRPVEETAITTVRSGPAASDGESQPGSVLGTPSYMAPEQARGEHDQIDERADVFGLGAILCEVLTGKPPFVGASREEIRAQAAQGDLADARARLDACAADAELIELARSCLRPERDRRPRTAGEVAGRITAYMTGVQERLRHAELARVEAQTRAEEAQARARIERSGRRLAVGLAASMLITAGVVGGGWTYLARQRLARAERIHRALIRAETLYTEAERAGDDPARWLTARDAAQSVENLLADAPDEPTRRRVTALVRDVTSAATAAENDQKLLAKVIDIRSAGPVDEPGSVTDWTYTNAFREAGIDLDASTPAEVGAKIRARRPAVSVALAAALDDWADVRRSLNSDQAGARQLTELARLADPDPWRDRLRELLQAAPSPDRLTRLKDLDQSARFDELPAATLHLWGAALLKMGEPARAERVLRTAQRLYTNDVWINIGLARCLQRLERRDEAMRFYFAARSLRPDMAHDLAHALEETGETDQAIAVFQDLARLRPNDVRHLACLGKALKDRGRTQEAKAVGDEAIAAARASIAQKPDSAYAHFQLGGALGNQGRSDEAVAAFRAAVRLNPNHAGSHYNLANSLGAQGKLEESVAEYREALRLKPDYLEARNNLGGSLSTMGRLDEAIAEYREVLRLNPGEPEPHANLGRIFRIRGEFTEAIAELRKARDLGKSRPHFVQKVDVELAKAERAALLVAKLPEILAGKFTLSNVSEMVGFAQFCHRKNLHGASAWLWAAAFRAEPKLAEDMKVQHRYNAACAAALAGCGQGKDDQPLDEAAKARWRKQAIDWLRADLAAWSKVLDTAPPQARQAVAETLQHWKVDADLLGLRDPVALNRLPQAEQKACRGLWAEVDALLAKARGGTVP